MTKIYSQPIRLQNSVIINFSGRKQWLDFLRRDSYQGKKASKTTAVGWVWPAMPRLAYTSQGWIALGVVRIKNNSEWKINYILRSKGVFFPSCYISPKIINQNLLSNQIAGFFDPQYLWNKTTNAVERKDKGRKDKEKGKER